MNAKFARTVFVQISTAAAIFGSDVAIAATTSLCGTYTTSAGATVQYEYDPSGSEPVILPLEARLTLSCDHPTTTLQARFETAIIGVDENGQAIFPIGNEFPMTVTADSVDGRQFTGSLGDTPYLFTWQFQRTPEGSLIWNGDIFWSGGRFEHTVIPAVELIRNQAADLNGDGHIDAADAGIMFAVWGHLGGISHDADTNGDGFVDAADAGRMFSQWDSAQVSSDRLVGRSLVPEPSGIVQLVITAIVWLLNRHTSWSYAEEFTS